MYVPMICLVEYIFFITFIITCQDGFIACKYKYDINMSFQIFKSREQFQQILY